MPLSLIRSTTLDLGGGVLRFAIVANLRRSGVAGTCAGFAAVFAFWVDDRERRWVDRNGCGRT
jgi:hypothetical protein